MKSLGLVTVATKRTPVQLSAVSKSCDSIMVRPVKAFNVGAAVTENVGNIYIGTAGMNADTGTGVLLVLSMAQPAQTIGPLSNTHLADDVSNYWVDADNNGDGVLVAYA